jgi:hypothetical protein
MSASQSPFGKGKGKKKAKKWQSLASFEEAFAKSSVRTSTYDIESRPSLLTIESRTTFLSPLLVRSI